MITLMLEHIQMLKKTMGQVLDVDYMIFLEHLAYNLCEISDETRCTFPEIDWTCVNQMHELIAYEVQHVRPGDVIESVSEELLHLADALPPIREKLLKKLEVDERQRC
jgi:uncharacterized protein with HEPN domain